MPAEAAIHPLLPHLVTSLPGPNAQKIIERDHAVLSPSYTRCYPFVMKRGEGAIVEDVDGNRFLDFAAGIAVVATGHSHPKVVRAIQEQAADFLHMSGTDFYYETMVQLAERLATLAPGSGPKRVYFGNSGAEANEAAIKLARYHTGRDKFVSFFGAFHGRTMGALSLTGSKVTQRRGFHPPLPVHHIAYPNVYRRPVGMSEAAHALECVRVLEDQLFKAILPPEEVAAIFVEPIQGEGGYLVPPKEFHQELRRVADRHGILLVHDEVQSGMGRTGRMFASEHFGVEPDIVTLAKGIASGLPLSATIARADIMNWPPGAHASTFGGNPVAIAAALATLDLLEGGVMANAAEMGQYLLERLQSWPQRFRHVGHVRGLGLMIAIELVADQQTKERAPQLRDQLEFKAFEHGLLVLGAGPNSIRLCPPLIIDRAQADFAIETLEKCLRELEQ
ncbi:MAG TPA: acetyl ornithine aminotransferase family protein [Bryobacteraceae bacterium]|jgi:4-aminobutyrate aminotransferase|nr:acetyl ornithine aminotransferase family protein [Bryobacteraceae bacterium]